MEGAVKGFNIIHFIRKFSSIERIRGDNNYVYRSKGIMLIMDLFNKKTILVSNAYQIHTINKDKKVFLPNVDFFVLYLTFFCFLKQLE